MNIDETVIKTYLGCAVDELECEGICKEIHSNHCPFKYKIKLIRDKKGLNRIFLRG